MRVWKRGAPAEPDEWKRIEGRRVVFTNGCFAAIHAGHLHAIQEAARLGDALVVAFNAASTIRKLKGHTAIIEDATRGAMLSVIPGVTLAICFEDDTPERLLWEIQPHVLYKGGATDAIVGREIVEATGGTVVRGTRLNCRSTTEELRQA